MALFKKSSSLPIPAFWQWWNDEGAARVEAAIRTKDFGNLAAVITKKVKAIHPDLVWELGQGKSSEHCLTVSAGGVAVARPLAERWKRSAPAPSPEWEYAAARERSADALSNTLEFEGVALSLVDALLAVEVDEARAVVDVAMFHPAFERLPREQQLAVVFLALDWTLGEDDVERWIGEISSVDAPPSTPVGLAALPGVVDALAARTKEEWVLMEAPADKGMRRLVQAQRPLRWIDHPLLDLHSEVELRYSTSRSDGLPDEESLEQLRTLEHGLEDAAGGRARLLAIDTSSGKRSFHLYSDSEDQNAADAISRWTAITPGAHVTHSHDPSWTRLRAYG